MSRRTAILIMLGLFVIAAELYNGWRYHRVLAQMEIIKECVIALDDRLDTTEECTVAIGLWVIQEYSRSYPQEDAWGGGWTIEYHGLDSIASLERYRARLKEIDILLPHSGAAGERLTSRDTI